MNLINASTSTNENSLEALNSSDNKLNFKYSSKIRSENSLIYIKCNKFNKSLITGIYNNSEDNSQNSISKKNLKFKKKFGITPFEELNSDNIDKIILSKIKVFEALENLLKNDNDIDDNIIDDNLNNEIITKKRKKELSIPKLDFSNIYNDYNRKPLFIKEVQYISKYN